MSHLLNIGADTYRMDVFPLPATAETTPMPLDLCIAGGNVWLGCEFDRRVYSLPIAAVDGATMQAVIIPAPASPLFRIEIFGDNPSAMGQVEKIAADSSGNLWITQTGSVPYGGIESQRGRVLRHDPAKNTWQAFPLPWNTPGVNGLALHGDQLWISCSGGGKNGCLAVTRPKTWLREQTDPTTFPLPATDTEYGGWRRVDYSPQWPAHMVNGPDGRLWVCNYWGNSVSAVDRTTFAVQTFPLPSHAWPGKAPWQIAFDLGGGLWVALDGDGAVAKLNPGNGAWAIYPTGLLATEHPHSLVREGGAWWFTAYSATTGGRIGRRTTAGAMELSEQLDTLGYAKGAAGCAIDGSGRLWVALFGSKAIGRLTKL